MAWPDPAVARLARRSTASAVAADRGEAETKNEREDLNVRRIIPESMKPDKKKILNHNNNILTFIKRKKKKSGNRPGVRGT